MKNMTILMTLLLFLLAGCNSSSGEKGKFEIGDKTFLLNDKPFIIKAAEIHYTRIPVEYWEHRIQMCKALGMNTIVSMPFGTSMNRNPESSILPDKMISRHSAVWLKNTVCISCYVPVRMFARNGKWAVSPGGC